MLSSARKRRASSLRTIETLQRAEALGDGVHLQVDDAFDVAFAERVEADDVVDAVEELGADVQFESRTDRRCS